MKSMTSSRQRRHCKFRLQKRPERTYCDYGNVAMTLLISWSFLRHRVLLLAMTLDVELRARDGPVATRVGLAFEAHGDVPRAESQLRDADADFLGGDRHASDHAQMLGEA